MGVPVICPVVLLKLSPVGKLGETVNIKGASPPVAVTGVNAVAATDCVSDLLLTDCTVSNTAIPDSTVRLNDAVAVWLPASVNVTTNVVLANAALVVPEIVTSTELYNLGTPSVPVIDLTVSAVVAVSPVGNAGLTEIVNPVTVPVVENDVAVAEPP